MSYNSRVLKIPSTVAVAIEVINGIYGNDESRKTALCEAGYDYLKVQKCVDDLFPIFQKYEDD